jgi:hypothetical protein
MWDSFLARQIVAVEVQFITQMFCVVHNFVLFHELLVLVKLLFERCVEMFFVVVAVILGVSSERHCTE